MLNWLRSLVAAPPSGAGDGRPRPGRPGGSPPVDGTPSPFVDLDRRRDPDGPSTRAPKAGSSPAPALDLAATLRATLDSALAALQGTGGGDGDDLLTRLGSGNLDTVIRQLPGAARQVMGLMHGSDANLSRLAQVVEGDPALSQSLLKHANSAWYTRRFGSAASSVKLAIQRVGLRGVEATVMARSLEGSLSRPGHGLTLMERMVWDHMVRVAHLARELCVGAGMDPDRLYTLGLVHDVGKLVVFNEVSDRRRELRRDLDVHPVWVGEVLRAIHEPLGGLALLSWGLDPRDARAVAVHHRDPPPEDLPEVALLATAERMDLARVRDAVRTAS
jgi:HD-like signal output (HDOD) protein